MLIRQQRWTLRASLFGIAIYRQLETDRQWLAYFPTCVYSIFGDEAGRERTHVGGPTIYAGRKVLERIQRASGTFFHPARRFLFLLFVCRQTADRD